MCFSMASLLSKFRIDYSDLKVIPDITKSPQEETVKSFEALIKELKVPDEDEDGGKSSHPSVVGPWLVYSCPGFRLCLGCCRRREYHPGVEIGLTQRTTVSLSPSPSFLTLTMMSPGILQLATVATTWKWLISGLLITWQ